MSATIILKPATEGEPATTLSGKFIVLARHDRHWFTEPKSVVEFGFVPAPKDGAVQNSVRVMFEVISDGRARRLFIVDADGQLHAEGELSESAPQGRDAYNGDSITFQVGQFILLGFHL